MVHEVRSAPGSRVLLLMVGVLAVSPMAAFGEAVQKITAQEEVKASCAGLHSPDWKQRQEHFNALVGLGMDGKTSLTAPRDGTRTLVDRYPELRDLISTSLIGLLQMEDKLVAA